MATKTETKTPALPLTADDARAIKGMLITAAEHQLSAYPQYKGMWNNWSVVRAKKSLRSPQTSQTIAVKGKCYLRSPEIRTFIDSAGMPRTTTTIFSHSNLGGCNTAVDLKDFEAV